MGKNDILFFKLAFFYFVLSISVLYAWDDASWDKVGFFEEAKLWFLEFFPSLHDMDNEFIFFNGAIVVWLLMLFLSLFFLVVYFVFFDVERLQGRSIEKNIFTIVIYSFLIVSFDFLLAWGLFFKDLSMGGESKLGRLFYSMRHSRVTFSVVSSLFFVGVHFFVPRMMFLSFLSLVTRFEKRGI